MLVSNLGAERKDTKTRGHADGVPPFVACTPLLKSNTRNCPPPVLICARGMVLVRVEFQGELPVSLDQSVLRAEQRSGFVRRVGVTGSVSSSRTAVRRDES